MMMNDDFRRLKHYLVRLNTVVSELESLEDWVNVDYSDQSTDLGFITVMLEQRRDRLLKRGCRL